MIFGVIVGTYSSIWVASAIVLWLGVKRDWGEGATARPGRSSATPRPERRMRTTEIDFEGRLPVDGYGPGGFRVAGAVHRGPLALVPDGGGGLGGLPDLAPFLERAAEFDVLLVGIGAAMRPLPEGFAAARAALEAAGAGRRGHGDAVGLPDLQRAAGRGAAGRRGADAGLTPSAAPAAGGYNEAGFARLRTRQASEETHHGFRTSRSSLSARRAGRVRHVEGDARVPPRHPPQGLCRQRQQGDRRHRVGEQSRSRRSSRAPTRRARWRRTASSTTPASTGTTASSGRWMSPKPVAIPGGAREGDHRRLRLGRQVQGGVRRRRRRPVRLGLGLAGQGRRRAEGDQDRERGEPALLRPDRAPRLSTSGSIPTTSTSATSGRPTSPTSSTSW